MANIDPRIGKKLWVFIWVYAVLSWQFEVGSTVKFLHTLKSFICRVNIYIYIDILLRNGTFHIGDKHSWRFSLSQSYLGDMRDGSSSVRYLDRFGRFPGSFPRTRLLICFPLLSRRLPAFHAPSSSRIHTNPWINSYRAIRWFLNPLFSLPLVCSIMLVMTSGGKS